MFENRNASDIRGDLNDGTTLLRPIEIKLINYLAPKVPKFIETNHLTLFSLGLSTMMVVGAALARNHISWFWLVIVSMLLHHVSDALDGQVGRIRNTGLVRWGFYMDHLFDFLFMCSLFISHLIVWPEDGWVFIWLMVVFGLFFMHEALSCIVLGKYNVRGYFSVSATELIYLMAFLDVVIVLLKLKRVWFIYSPLGVVVVAILIYVVFKRQKLLWRVDIKNKQSKA